jgi:hypothetical protein
LAESVELPPPLVLPRLGKVLLAEEGDELVPRRLVPLLSPDRPPPPVCRTLQLVRGKGHAALHRGAKGVEDLLQLLKPVLCLGRVLIPLEGGGLQLPELSEKLEVAL